MKCFWVILISFCCQSLGISQSKAAYQLFTGKGKVVNYDKLLTKALKSDFICFGELHNNPIAHWLELEMAKDLYASKTKTLVVGVEMIESDNQAALDSFLIGTMDDMTFDSSVRLWPNYATDYEPLVLWAKENQVGLIASNIPRRYASMVYKKGLIALDSIQDFEKRWMMPLPIEIDYNLKIYKEMMEMMPDHQSPNFPAAQAVKDATMAWRSVARLNIQSRIFHINGTGHSDWHQGILWYVAKYRPDTKTLNIACRLQDDISQLEAESLGAADFILVIPSSMTTTY